MPSHLLTKSLFQKARECPRKAQYSLDPRYANLKADDEFLQALADGGFQAGALAKAHFRSLDPDAIEINSGDIEAQVAQTQALLARENVTLFETSFRHGDLFMRADVVRKRGNELDLFEVKAKGWSADDR